MHKKMATPRHNAVRSVAAQRSRILVGTQACRPHL
jgi:hypothetical protein